MDADQFSRFMSLQMKAMEDLVGSVRNVQVNQPAAPAVGVGSAAASSVPRPPPLELEGDMEQNYNFFEENWKTYVSAVGMDAWPVTRNKQKTSILLSVVGRDALKQYFNFELNDAQKTDPDLALAAIKVKVVRERNKFVDWFDFFSLLQDPVENIDNYLCRVQSLAKLCKFGTLEEDMIKYKLATSIKWLKLRSKLITTQNLTEANAVDLCHAEEITERHPVSVSQPSVEVNMVKKGKMKCKFCGGKHDFAKGACPALGKKCNGCGGKNHFEKVCKAEQKKKLKKKLRVNKVHEDSSSDSESSERGDNEYTESAYSVSIGNIIDKSGSGGHFTADLNLFLAGKWQSARCELDTGANISLVGQDWLERMTGYDKIELLPSTYRLQGFGGSNIPVIGQVKVPCWRNNRKYNLVLQVVDVKHGPLLSANVCRILGFVKFCNTVKYSAQNTEQELMNIYRVKAQDIVKQHEEAFHGIGKLSGSVSLEVHPHVPPSTQPPRRVPIEMSRKSKEEVRSLEHDELILKHTDRQADRVIDIELVKCKEQKSESILFKVKDEELREIIEETVMNPSSPLSMRFIQDGWPTSGIPMSDNNLIPKLVSGKPEAIAERRRKAKYQYDRKTRNVTQLETGSSAYVQLNQETLKTAMVSNMLNERSYVVDVGGAHYRRDLVKIKPRNEPHTPKEIPDHAVIPSAEPPTTEQSPNEVSFLPVSEKEFVNKESNASIPDAVLPEVTRTPKPSRTPRSRSTITPSSGSAVEERQSVRSKRSVKLPIRFKD